MQCVEQVPDRTSLTLAVLMQTSFKLLSLLPRRTVMGCQGLPPEFTLVIGSQPLSFPAFFMGRLRLCSNKEIRSLVAKVVTWNFVRSTQKAHPERKL